MMPKSLTGLQRTFGNVRLTFEQKSFELSMSFINKLLSYDFFEPETFISLHPFLFNLLAIFDLVRRKTTFCFLSSTSSWMLIDRLREKVSRAYKLNFCSDL